MVGIDINLEAPMTTYLVNETDVFRKDPVTILDIGARWGFNAEWKVFGEHLRVVCFEPDEEECRKLNAKAPRNVIYIPKAIGRQTGEATLYITRIEAGSGLYRANRDFCARLLNGDNQSVVSQRQIQVVTLEDALREHDVAAFDFVKLDVEGAELDVLSGGERYLANNSLLGILSEAWFHSEVNGCPPFWKLDDYMRRFGFRMFGLDFYHQSRRVLPYPGLYNYKMEDGTRFFAYTTHGQVMDGNALYFRDVLIPQNADMKKAMSVPQVLKLAALYEIYCLNDCAAELIITFRDILREKVDCDHLLDLLVPAHPGKRLDYRSYLQKYFDTVEGVITEDDFEQMKMDSRRLRALRSTMGRTWVGRLTKQLFALAGLLRSK